MFSSTRSKRNRSRPLKDSTGRAPHCRRLAVWSGSTPERGPHRGLWARRGCKEDRVDARPTIAGTLPRMTMVRVCAAMRGVARRRCVPNQFWSIAARALARRLNALRQCRLLGGARQRASSRSAAHSRNTASPDSTKTTSTTPREGAVRSFRLMRRTVVHQSCHDGGHKRRTRGGSLQVHSGPGL